MTMFIAGFISAYLFTAAVFIVLMMCIEKGTNGTYNIWRKRS